MLMRRTFLQLSAAAAASSSAVSAAAGKMKSLHKLLTGEVQFKNNAPVKVCNIEHNFGAQWQTELEAYAETLPSEEKAILQRQIGRVLLTRYTTRELALYGGDGLDQLDAKARASNIEQGKAYLEKYGEEKFVQYVEQEGKHANWSEDQVQDFIRAVKG